MNNTQEPLDAAPCGFLCNEARLMYGLFYIQNPLKSIQVFGKTFASPCNIM